MATNTPSVDSTAHLDQGVEQQQAMLKLIQLHLLHQHKDDHVHASIGVFGDLRYGQMVAFHTLALQIVLNPSH
jgi:hypothetical protein